MTRNQKLKYARAVLLMQDRIALKYQKDIKRELKLTASQLANPIVTGKQYRDWETVS